MGKILKKDNEVKVGQCLQGILLMLMLFATGLKPASAQLSFDKVLVNGRENPLGINTDKPQFSWRLKSVQNNVSQTAFRIRVEKAGQVNPQLVWDSGWQTTDQSLFVTYAGQALEAGRYYQFHVQVKDNKGNRAQSEKAVFLVGLLQPKDWGASQWIAKELLPKAMVNPLPLSSSKFRIDQTFELPVFRKTFTVNKKLLRSTAYISGLGHYELLLNGEKVEDAFLQPGWSKYDKEALYVALDVTKQVQKGKNSIGILLGNGFYYIPPVKGRYQKHKVAFGLPKVKMKLVNHYSDGSEEVIVTDKSWKVHRSPITFSSMYGGEDYDGHVLPSNWPDVAFDDRNWQAALEVDGPPLVAQEADPVRVMHEFSPVRSFTSPKNGNTVYDFGQNASGIVAVKLKGKQGDTVRIYPAELLTADSTANQKATGSPYYYQYVFEKDGLIDWQPRFTYYGFRFAEVALLPQTKGAIQLKGIKALHIRNAAETVGSFHSSDSLFNQIHRLIKWAINSNMVSVFTDCPHREKLGWLEQLHLMGPSVQYNYDVERLFAKSLRDMRLSQTPAGLVPEIAPEYVQFDWGGDMFRDSPEWGSSSIILAWYAYRWYGNKTFLTDNYAMMCKYIDYLGTKAKDHILTQGLGDWYDLGPERPGVSQLTTPGITATAIYYYDLKLMVDIATLLGKKEDAEKFKTLQEAVFNAFNQQFYHPQEQRYGSGSQTALAMPLYVGLVPQDLQQPVFEKLTTTVCQNDTALTAGDIGHRYLLQTLQQHNRDELIYAMHHRDDRPGYGYQLRKGATALTESWAGLPNVSNNHFMLGHLMEWFHTGLGGIGQEAESTGFKHFRIAPKMLDVLKDCEVSFRSPYGKIYFNRNQAQGNYQLEVPVNSRCTLLLPKGTYQVNGKAVEAQTVNVKENHVELQLGSGKYTITQ
ncbi:family 78 glycoside hydrolase catalytic domain [Sphingobacterium sp. N143]|uniref:family 78 glycoside hydrolase catalytic domain n=1 Tax=Sphingobacterium sp. N143 TaxID=2746727 RepID=UPI002574E24D|nr:family 78 glycoside hydrolase catalytic domain [Sphingobacterium sp. N143]MDM1293613.1 family 78 glycoside hydrolase catalytic domain [Sphingobacterium sp. N143]